MDRYRLPLFVFIVLSVISLVGLAACIFLTPERLAGWKKQSVLNAAKQTEDLIRSKNAAKIKVFHLKDGTIAHLDGFMPNDKIIVVCAQKRLAYPIRDFSFLVRQVYFSDQGGLMGKEMEKLEKLARQGVASIDPEKL